MVYSSLRQYALQKTMPTCKPSFAEAHLIGLFGYADDLSFLRDLIHEALNMEKLLVIEKLP